MTQTLDGALKARLRAVVDERPVTEAELRKLAEEGRAWVLILVARLDRAERRLDELSADEEASLAEIAATFRTVDETGRDLDELRALLRRLDARAREARAAWLVSTG